MPLGNSRSVRNRSSSPPAEQGYVRPIVRPADGGTNGYGYNVQQLVPLTPLNPRVLYLTKILHYGCSLPFLHHSPSFINHTFSLLPDYTTHNAIALALKVFNLLAVQEGATIS